MGKKRNKKQSRPNIVQTTIHNPQPMRNVVVQQSFSGPLPPPDVLRKYEEFMPGAAERIFQMAEQQAGHRQSLETKVVTSDISRSKWGQILGFVLSFVALVIACILGLYGKTVAASVIGAGTLVSLVSVFIYGKIKRQKELGDNQ